MGDTNSSLLYVLGKLLGEVWRIFIHCSIFPHKKSSCRLLFYSTKTFFSRLCGFYLTSPLWNVTASIAWRLSVFLLYLIGDNTRSSIWCKQDSGGIRPPLSSADKVNAFRLMWSTHRLHRKVVSNLSDPRAPHNLIRIGISHHHNITCSDCVKESHHAT